MHVGQRDLAVAVALAPADEILELLVDLDDAGIGIGVLVSDEGGENNIGVGGGRPEEVEELVHPFAGLVNLEVLNGIVGTYIDSVEVGLVDGHVCLGMVVEDLAYTETWEAFIVVVGHGAVVLAPYVGDLVPGAL